MKPKRCCAAVAWVDRLEQRRLLSFAAHINFEPAGAPIPTGYLADTGAVYAARNGYSYGWNADNSVNTRDRNSSLSPDQRYDTLIHMQKSSDPNASWEIAVPSGQYQVHIVCGDPTASDSVFKVAAEGTLVVSGTPSSANHWLQGTATITVSDGRLTISNAAGSSNNKINFIDITDVSNIDPNPNPNLTWHTASSAPFARAEGTRAVVNNLMYVVGGFTSASTLAVTNQLDVFDPAANTWTRLADMPVPETHGAAAVYGTDIWVGGFFKNDGVSASSLIYKYDTVHNTWTQEPSLPAGRGAAGMAILGHMLHVWGGLTGATTSAADHWALDLDNVSGGWQTLAPLPQRLSHMGSVSLNGKLWSIGGFMDKTETSGNQSIVYRYDPASDKWSADVAAMPLGLSHINPDTVIAGSDIVIAGGQYNASADTVTTQVLQYDPTTNKWSYLPSLPAARKSACAGYINGKLIVSCGNQANSPYLSATTWVGY